MKGMPEKPSFLETLFGGSPFIFWSLGPLFLLVAAVFVRFACTQFTEGHFGRFGSAVAIAVVCVCFFLALLNGSYFWWAGRVVAVCVFGAYLWYLLDTWLIHPKPFAIGGRRSDATPWNALCGLVIFGIPCLLYAFRGCFTSRAQLQSDEDETEANDERPNDDSRNA